ncbi:NAD(P)-dependent oxidoreductase [Pseudomonas monteilii]|uniref:NAD(P)-dependent oxidoreductase n=1 Tax=Pseudomonas monteilii TaxID=76759 RepID=UPI003CFDBCE2
MANIAFLGLGAMGSRMATTLLTAGHHVIVWNRSTQPTRALVALGAKLASTSYNAADGADFVISMVRDDEASKEVWLKPATGALSAMRKSTIAIECSTLSHEWVMKLSEYADDAGIQLIDAPVSGSRPQAESGQLIFLAGGTVTAITASQQVLLDMGAMVNHVGSLGAGTLVKLATNALLGIQVTAIAELIAVLSSYQVDVHKAFQAIGSTTVSSAAGQRSALLMLASEHQPQFPIDLISKDFDYLIKAAGKQKSAPTIIASNKIFKHAQANGLGSLNMTGVEKLFPVSVKFPN